MCERSEPSRAPRTTPASSSDPEEEVMRNGARSDGPRLLAFGMPKSSIVAASARATVASWAAGW
jgi:hypothetical protein